MRPKPYRGYGLKSEDNLRSCPRSRRSVLLAVIIEAKHMCVSSRGIEDEQSSTVTADYHGAFKENEARREFLDHIRG